MAARAASVRTNLPSGVTISRTPAPRGAHLARGPVPTGASPRPKRLEPAYRKDVCGSTRLATENGEARPALPSGCRGPVQGAARGRACAGAGSTPQRTRSRGRGHPPHGGNRAGWGPACRRAAGRGNIAWRVPARCGPRRGGTQVSQRCEVCGKGPATGHAVSHSNIKNRRRFEPNLQLVRRMENGHVRRVRMCTRCLRTSRKAGA